MVSDKIIKDKVDFFNDKIIKNTDKLIPFFNHKFIVFCQLNQLIFENLNCLLLGLNQSSVFTTNHLLERMLKMALSEFHTKGYYIRDPELKKKLDEAKDLYDNVTLNNTIKYAFEKGIINEDEKNELIKLKNEYRNPYSHAQISTIVTGAPSSCKGYMGNFSEIKDALSKGNEIPIKEQEFPSDILFQTWQSDIANLKAFSYFKQVFNMMINIDKRYQD